MLGIHFYITITIPAWFITCNYYWWYYFRIFENDKAVRTGIEATLLNFLRRPETYQRYQDIFYAEVQLLLFTVY